MGHPTVYPTVVTIFDKEEAASGWTLCVLDGGEGAVEALLLDLNGHEVRRWKDAPLAFEGALAVETTGRATRSFPVSRSLIIKLSSAGRTAASRGNGGPPRISTSSALTRRRRTRSTGCLTTATIEAGAASGSTSGALSGWGQTGSTTGGQALRFGERGLCRAERQHPRRHRPGERALDVVAGAGLPWRTLRLDCGAAGYGPPRDVSADGTGNVLRDFSRVLELDPATLEVVWKYTPVEAGFIHPLDSYKFHSPFSGAAQRLANGNTLIAEGDSGRVFEVTAKHRTVWEYVLPGFRTDARGFRYNRLALAARFPYERFADLPRPEETAMAAPNQGIVCLATKSGLRVKPGHDERAGEPAGRGFVPNAPNYAEVPREDAGADFGEVSLHCGRHRTERLRRGQGREERPRVLVAPSAFSLRLPLRRPPESA